MASKFTSRKGLALREVGHVLREMWVDTEGPAPRPSTGTLVVLGPSDRRDEAVAALDELQGQMPCRTVLALATKGARAGLLAEAGVVHHEEGRSCERVVVEANLESLSGTVLPLSVPDLPVAVWWLFPRPPGSGFLEERDLGADRLIFDSREIGFPNLAVLQPQDLAWQRTASWRQALASIFEPPSRRHLLAQLSLVRLSVGKGGRDSDAYLLAGWLADRLGWRGGKREGRAISFGRSDGGLTVTVGRTSVAGARPATVAAVEIEAGETTFQAALDADGRHVVFEANPEAVAWRAPFENASVGTLLGRAFTAQGNPAWQRAVERLTGWSTT